MRASTAIAIGSLAAMLALGAWAQPAPPGALPGLPGPGMPPMPPMAMEEPGPMPPGKLIFRQWCQGCHSPLMTAPDGSLLGRYPPAGTFVLQQRYTGSLPAALEQRTDLTPEWIRTVVRQGQTIMPPTRKSEVTDQEMEALVDYLLQRKSQ